MPPLCIDAGDMNLGQGFLPSLMAVDLFIFRSACLLEMMLTFFLLILLGFPSVDIAVNSSRGLDDSISGFENSTSGLDSAIQPRQQRKFELKTRSVLDGRILNLELTRVRRRCLELDTTEAGGRHLYSLNILLATLLV